MFICTLRGTYKDVHRNIILMATKLESTQILSAVEWINSVMFTQKYKTTNYRTCNNMDKSQRCWANKPTQNKYFVIPLYNIQNGPK